MVIVLHSLYSLGLTPCGFALSQIENETEDGVLKQSDIQRESQEILDIIKRNVFHGDFESWKKTMRSLYTFPRRLY
jgi:hypothetical protein